MTGGHNVFSAELGEYILVPGGAEVLTALKGVRVRRGDSKLRQILEYTLGGQIGAPVADICCETPPDKPGRSEDCPTGDWEHNHHQGPDQTGNLTNGSFGFHSGTASAPEEAYIACITCDDPGFCVQARCAPFKQIFWSGTGVFKAIKNILPSSGVFVNCLNNPIHYYKAHVADFGEPAGNKQKPADQCTWQNSGGIDPPAEFIDVIEDAPSPFGEKGGDICVECPDWYEIEIHCSDNPASQIMYRVGNYLTAGNHQIHPQVGQHCEELPQ
jgi:hypothetical protein